MLVSIVSDSQARLSSRATDSAGSTAASIRSMDRPRAEENPTQYRRFNAGWGNAERIKASANAMARQTGIMDTQVQNITHHIRRMSGDLRAFRKNFPPFPRGSEERERLLNSFQGIRKQIERLTIPPKKDVAVSFQGDAAFQPGSSSTRIEGFERLLQTIGERLPQIPVDTSDAAFRKLEEQLESLLEFISQQRAELGEFGKHYQESNDSQMAAQVTSTSMTLGRSFADQPDWRMTVSQTRLKVLQA
jgi:hypothetical protein